MEEGSFGFGSLDDLIKAMQENGVQGQVNGYQIPPQGSGRKNGKNTILNTYGINLTKKAQEGKLDPVIGRDQETSRAIEVLNRRTKNNPVLIGEAGVGKTAIVEGLAQRIANGKVPQKLQNKQVIQLDMVSMVQGTGIRGQFEKKMQELIKEVRQNRNIILFIDEIHEIMGSGNTEGGMDAGNILKPALARGDFQLIGATTLNEYRNIEKDSALSRRLQKVMVDEPSEKQALKIIQGLLPHYEKYHMVHYTPEAVSAMVKLSKRYINDRYLPDKAIDLMDETGSRKNLSLNIVDPKTINKQLEYAEKAKEDALAKEDYEKAAYFRDQISKLTRNKDANQQASQQPNTVTEADVQKVIEEMTDIPVGELEKKEQRQLKDLPKDLRAHLIGQDQAVNSVTRAIKRNRIGFNQTGRPIGSFLFVGPTGVGKTELAKQLAKQLFGSKDALIRFDMSEYREPQSVAKLIGAAPGYVGYEEAGQLTEKVRRHPYSLILLDEVEKAHPDVLHSFLQVLDDGRLTDSQGRTVSFKDTVIIMTSNAGQQGESNVGFGAESKGLTHSVKDKLGYFFKPEFLNRFDDIVEFNVLNTTNLEKIVDLMITDMNKMLKEKGIHIDVSKEAKEKLVKLGYNPEMGARPLRRVIQEQLEDKTADYFLDHQETNRLKADVNKDDEIVVSPE